MVYIDVV